MRKILTAVLAAITCCMVALFAACESGDGNKPQKLKDGIALTITEGESKNIDLSEYISIAGTEYAYTADSSAKDIATVTVDGNTAKVTAVAEGTATVTASADEVSVSFAVTVTAKQPITPAPEKADKTALAAELALEVAEQGDFTAESYAAYSRKLQAAKTVNAKTDATQTEVDTACGELKAAREGLVLRVPEAVADADKTVAVISGRSKEITISEYIDAKNLSSVTYEVTHDGTLVTVGEIKDGKFTVTAGQTEEDAEVALGICAKYKGEAKLTVTLTVQVKSEVQPTLTHSHVTQSVDIYSLENKADYTIDFTQNVESNGVENLVYAVTSGGAPVTLDGNNRLTYNLDGAYSETAEEVVFDVAVTYGAGKSISYVYTLKITDTTDYRAVNGGFGNGLDGWTLNGEIGGISENSTFWEEKFPIFNKEQYFSGDGKEAGKGTLTSSWFKVGGVKKITFMLGAAGNKDCYITLENTDGTVLAIWRNAKFEDVAGKWDYNEIGETQFACNLVTYVADLGAYAGETLRIVLHDNAESGFGFFNFDELVTYYAAEADVPVKATVAVNELADKAELKTLVDGALSARGDYTDESYNAYAEKVAAAQKVLDKISATQTETDAAKTAIETAYKALQLRTPAEKADADKSFSLLFNGSKELTVSDYIDDNSLSSLTYEVTSADAKVTVSAVADGKFTVTAGNEEVDGAQIVIAVKYKGEEKLRVTITVKVTSETAPVLKKAAVETDIDLYSAENKTDITLDFAGNVDNVGGLTLDYAATLDGSPLTLDGASYTFAYGSYTETATEVVFTVTVSFSQNGENKELSYTYTLNIKDTRAYRIANGGFDNGLDGWTLSNSDLGGVNADTRYWDGIPFNNDGNFFNAYYFNGEAKEDATGTLKSSPFTVGGSGWITYKLGGAKNIETVTFEIVSAADETKRAVLPNFDWSDVAGNTQVRGCTLVAYKANLLDYGFDKGESVYILATDNAVNDYGLFFLDSVVTYYPQAPEGNFNLVAPTRLFNGGFESGLSGWEVKTTEDGGGEFGFLSTNAGATWGDENNPKSYNNDGNFFQNGCEQSKGYLLSSVFEVSQSGWITFKLAGNKALNYVAVVDAETGDVLAKFVNENYVGAWPNNGWEMYAYKANLLESGIEAGRKVRIKVVDDAIGDYGVVVVDSFVTHYVAEPDVEFTKANNTL